MLDIERLKKSRAIKKYSSDFTGKIIDVKALIDEYCRTEKDVFDKKPWKPQVPAKEFFPAAIEIFEALDGVCLWTEPCAFPSLDFTLKYFSGSERMTKRLHEIWEQIGQKALYFACSEFDDDFLVGEDGRIYQQRFGGEVVLYSDNIYSFLETDILDGKKRCG